MPFKISFINFILTSLIVICFTWKSKRQGISVHHAKRTWVATKFERLGENIAHY